MLCGATIRRRNSPLESPGEPRNRGRAIGVAAGRGEGPCDVGRAAASRAGSLGRGYRAGPGRWGPPAAAYLALNKRPAGLVLSGRGAL